MDQNAAYQQHMQYQQQLFFQQNSIPQHQQQQINTQYAPHYNDSPPREDHKTRQTRHSNPNEQTSRFFDSREQNSRRGQREDNRKVVDRTVAVGASHPDRYSSAPTSNLRQDREEEPEFVSYKGKSDRMKCTI